MGLGLGLGLRLGLGLGMGSGLGLGLGLELGLGCVTDTLNILLAVTGSLKRPTSACLGQPRYAAAQY